MPSKALHSHKGFALVLCYHCLLKPNLFYFSTALVKEKKSTNILKTFSREKRGEGEGNKDEGKYQRSFIQSGFKDKFDTYRKRGDGDETADEI